MRTLLLALLGIALVGCAAPSDEEAKAARELAPKPASSGQVDKIKARFPQGGGTSPGR